MQALEHGRKLNFKELHYQSVLPSKILADAKNSRRTQTIDHFWKETDFQIYKELAFPDAKTEIDPEALAAFYSVSMSGYMPPWIAEIVPRVEWLDRAARSNVKPSGTTALISPHLAIFAPKIEDEIITSSLVVFKAQKFELGRPTLLTDFDTEEDLFEVRIPQYGTGYLVDDVRLVSLDRVENG